MFRCGRKGGSCDHDVWMSRSRSRPRWRRLLHAPCKKRKEGALSPRGSCMACPPKGFALRASNPGLWIPEGDWHQYEAYIFGSLQRRFPEARVLPNAHLPGIKCGKMRQIDVLVERSLGEFDLKIAFDCKCYKRKVNVNDVERFLGMLDDIRVSKGVLVTTKGYSKTAYARAQREPRDVDLQILTPDRLSQY